MNDVWPYVIGAIGIVALLFFSALAIVLWCIRSRTKRNGFGSTFIENGGAGS